MPIYVLGHFSVYIYIHLYTYICVSFAYILFIHSSVNEHLLRLFFHILAIVNNAAINLEMHISF